MSDIITIPAGVIMPKDLLMWLRKQRDAATREVIAYANAGDHETEALYLERANTYAHVISHISDGTL